MYQKIRIIIIAGMISLLIGCSPIHVSFEYQKSRDYSVYKNYAWLTENVLVDVEDGLLMLDMPGNGFMTHVDDGLRKKGYKIDPHNPQFLILVHMGLKENVTVTDKSYGKGKIKIEVESHPEGSVFLDVIDAESFDLVWRGTAVKEADNNPTEKSVKKNIKKALDMLVAEFPPES